ncbi:hypothetical protein BJV74DRAFT_169574 [Russula compacta]|nr:hypothetical protein BJV74DRAFT_169574 [Russula compacta]
MFLLIHTHRNPIFWMRPCIITEGIGTDNSSKPRMSIGELYRGVGGELRRSTRRNISYLASGLLAAGWPHARYCYCLCPHLRSPIQGSIVGDNCSKVPYWKAKDSIQKSTWDLCPLSTYIIQWRTKVSHVTLTAQCSLTFSSFHKSIHSKIVYLGGHMS